MKHIHIVNPYQSVAMIRLTTPLLAELPSLYIVSEGQAPDDSADLNLHIPYHTLIGYEGKNKQAMMYTHCNPPDVPSLLDACRRADLIVCMSFTGRKELVELGVDPRKLWVIYSGADSFQYRKRIIGVIGFLQPNGRKRESILTDLAWKYDLAGYRFLIAGEGWEYIVERLEALGVSVTHVKLADDEQLRSFYNSMDALLVTGYAEGGPLPLLEAMAAGVPVFSPRFGYAADLLDEWQFYDTVDDLGELLDKTFHKSRLDHQIARSWSWKDYAAEYAFVIGRLLGESTEVFPAQGMDRYSQLMDVIDECKPQSIAEIGTWNGNRAIQMIQQAAKYRPIKTVLYQGFDLFETQTGEQLRAELSKAGWPMEVVKKRVSATRANVDLVRGNTIDTLSPNVRRAGFYFIDGGHSEETVVHDWQVVKRKLPPATVVFDDYYHEGKPEGMGCNVVIDNLGDEWEVTHLPKRTLTADGREIGMVKVRRNDAGVRLQMQEQSLSGNYTPNERANISDVPEYRVWREDVARSADTAGDLERRFAAAFRTY